MEIICLRWRYDEARFELLKISIWNVWIWEANRPNLTSIITNKKFRSSFTLWDSFIVRSSAKQNKILDSEHYKYQGS